MTALSAARNTKVMAGGPNPELLSLPVKANTKIHAGSLVVIDAGYAAPGRTATGLITLGRAEETVDNTGGNAGDKRVSVRQGVFNFTNSADADAIAQAQVGGMSYIVDDQTVAKTDGSGARSAAGRIVQVDSDGVWVELGLGGIDYLAAGGDLEGTFPAPTIKAKSVAVDELAEATAEGLAPALVLRKAVAAGSAGAADDVAVVASVPAKMRLVDVQFRCTAGNAASRTAQLFDAVSGGGTALSDALDCATTGRKEQATASKVLAAGSKVYLHRSHDAVAGELVLTLAREA